VLAQRLAGDLEHLGNVAIAPSSRDKHLDFSDLFKAGFVRRTRHLETSSFLDQK
jgi:hypothetical protein